MTSSDRPVYHSVEAFLASLTAGDKRRIQRAVAEAMGLDIGTGFGGPTAAQPDPLPSESIAARAATETPAGPESSGRRGSQARRAPTLSRARRATTTSEVA